MTKISPSLLCSPPVFYLIVWGPLIYLANLDLFIFSTKGEPQIVAYVVSLIFLFFIIHIFLKYIFLSKAPPRVQSIPLIEIHALRRFTLWVFSIWCVGYLLNMLYSGGVPLLWVLQGRDITYSSYGMPTFSGLLNMIRVFMVISFVICSVHKIPLPKQVILLILLSLAVELNRAAMLFCLLVALVSFLFYNPLKLKRLFSLLILAIGFVVIFSFVAEFRQSGIGNYYGPQDYFIADISAAGAIMFLVLYYITPLNNLYYSFSLGLDPSYTPYFTFQSLLPTVVRDQVFTGETQYSVFFASEAFNTSPYIANIVSDFGLEGGIFVVISIQFFCCYTYFRAKRSSLNHILVFCVLWGAIGLSCFTNLFFTLIVILFPVLIMIFSRYKSSYIRKYTN